MSNHSKITRQHPYKQGDPAIIPSRKLLLEQFFRSKKLSTSQKQLKKQIIEQLWQKNQGNTPPTPHLNTSSSEGDNEKAKKC